MKTINPIIQYPWNYCHNCNTTSLELFSSKGNPQDYAKFISDYEKDPNGSYLNNEIISIIRCTNCRKTYKIFWDKNYPKPMTSNQYINIFSHMFIENSIRGRPKVITNIYKELLKKENKK